MIKQIHTISKGRLFLALVVSALATLFTGCGVYSFTGASIPPGAKTISIGYIENNADLVEPTLSSTFTEAVRERFLSQTDLTLVDDEGDLRIEGEIQRYSVTPVAIQGDETAALNRLTIAVKINYTNTLEPVRDFETTFSRFEDYSSNQEISQVKETLIPLITEQLVDDIFNKAVVNW